MTRDEIVTALRCCASPEVDCRGNCAFFGMSSPNNDCSQKKNTAAADLIENQQNHIAALLKANDSLKDAMARRDRHIEMLKKQVDVMAREQEAMGRRIAMKEEEKWART